MDSVPSVDRSIGGPDPLAIDEIQAWADQPGLDDQELEGIREITVANAQDDRLDAASRKRWAKLSLQANARMGAEGPWQQARQADNNHRLRALIIDRLGPDPLDPDWDSNLLASEILGALTMTEAGAREMSAGWRRLPIEQIGYLRRIKNATAPLTQLLRHLPPGPIHDQAREWLAVRDCLP